MRNLKHAAALVLALTCATAHADRADRTKPMYLEADHVSIDDAKQIKTFEGRVQFSQGTILVRGDKMVVTQDAEGNMHGTATGQPVSFRQKRDGLDEYINGYGQRVEYDAKTATVELYGQARVTRGQDEVRGEHITYNARTEIFQVHGTAPDTASNNNNSTDQNGRVHMVIQPKNKPAEENNAPLHMQPSDTLTPPPPKGNQP